MIFLLNLHETRRFSIAMFDYQRVIEIFSLLPMKHDQDSTYLYGMATMFLSIRLLEGMPMDIHFVSPPPCLSLNRKVVRITILVGKSGSSVSKPTLWLRFALRYAKRSLYG